MLEKLRTKKGESSILIILLFAASISLVALPVVAMIFDHGLVRIAAQEIGDEIDMQTYKIFQSIDFKALSDMTLKVDSNIIENINQSLAFNHPMIDSVKVKEIAFNKENMVNVHMTIELIMNPTLYRSIYQIDQVHHFNYSMLIPIDGGNHEEDGI